MEILTVKNLSFTYPLAGECVLKDVSFSVPSGSFVAVCGANGSGKSTLLRNLKRELIPNGQRKGSIELFGKQQEELDAVTAATKVGYVMQRPEQQLVTDKVWHELAFGLENMGLPTETIRRRVSEMACYFGIEDWFEKKVSELSGGQKQLLNLASVMVMQPEVLLLDEPTAQLDPIAAAGFIDTVVKLNRDFAITILCIEHRLEELLPLTDYVLLLEEGQVAAFGKSREVISELCSSDKKKQILQEMPAAVRLVAGLCEEVKGEAVLTVREGRDYLEANWGKEIKSLESAERIPSKETALEFSEVFFRYERNLPDVCRGLSFKVRRGEFFCLLGGNGSGKTTALSLAAGLNRAYAGKIKVFGKKIADYKNQTLYRACLTLLPQDVQTLFLKNTVREELEGIELSELPYDFSELIERHPYDLSGGEQQLLALAKVLATRPGLLLLDEPTKGLDAASKNRLAAILNSLVQGGLTILCVTHDVDFAAENADRCALMFRGEITSTEEPGRFFSENNFYTTAINRMTRGYYEQIVTVKDAISICKKNGRLSQ